MINERDLGNARRKVRHSAGVAEGLLLVREGLQKIFNTILDDELNHEEIMALTEYELDEVYNQFTH